MKLKPPKNKQHTFVRRRFFQIIVGVAALVPVLAGLAGVLMGPGMVDNPDASSLSLDSHYRYLSGLLMGIGVGFWTTIPNIEAKTTRFQLLSAIVFCGGLARLYALIRVGAPDAPMFLGLGMELIITPLLVLGQMDIARGGRK